MCLSGPQADVRRLKSATVKSQRTIITQIAASVEANPSWAELLSQFLASAPAMLEKGPVVKKYVQQLKKMKLGPEVVKDLWEMIQQVLSLQMQLRKGSCDEWVQLMLKALEQLWPQEGGSTNHDWSTDQLQEVLKLYEEAVNVFPDCATLQSSLHDIRNHIQDKAQTKMRDEVLEAMTVVCNDEVQDLEQFMSRLAHLKAQLHTNKLDLKALPEAKHQLLQETLQKLLEFVAAIWGDAKRCLDEVIEAIVVASSLANLLALPGQGGPDGGGTKPLGAIGCCTTSVSQD